MSEQDARDTSLANLILALLTPMFLWGTAGDIRLAHIAAAQTLNEFRIANRLSLFSVAKIIAFDIATLSSLGLSMYEDVSVLLALRLRGNAVSLDRAAERNRHLHEQESRSAGTGESVEAMIAEAQRMVQAAKARVREATAPAPETPPVAEPAAPVEAPPPEPPAAAGGAAQQRHSARAHAMTVVAEECAAGLQDLPPAERAKEMARIEALGIAATDLASGVAPPPFPRMAAT